jgi:hypothetical protein
LLNLRNDFSVWGERTSVSGQALPIHMRYAIDRKPQEYNSITIENDNEELKAYNAKYGTNIKG